MNKSTVIRKAKKQDIDAIRFILSDWLTAEEVDYYTKRIGVLISEPKYDTHYFVALLNNKIVGVAGYRQPVPKILKFASSIKPAELCLLYVDNEQRGHGVGTALLNFVIEQAKAKGYNELVVRSADKFAKNGWGFYDRIGLIRVGQLLPPESETISQIWTKKIN